MLLEFLASEQLPIPAEHDSGIWKHMPRPPQREHYIIPRAFQAIYLITDPVDAVLSIFRRGLQMAHAVRMQSEMNWPASFLLRDEPDAPWGLEDYLRLDRDCFGIIDQFEAWTNCSPDQRGYPIAVVKYEALWEKLGELFDFIGHPRRRIKSFPSRKARHPHPSCTSDQITILKRIYGDLCNTIATLPPFWVY